jgi:radical SAM-linked protein
MKTQRWRLTFAKTEAMRFTGHLDLILTWERTFRRSGLPLSYSEGFNPRPVINLAAPLPLGFTSTGEIGDFWLSNNMTKNEFSKSINRALPPGLEVLDIAEIPQLHGDKLPSLVQAAVYQMTLDNTYQEISMRIHEILAHNSLLRVRKGKEYDLRPLIHDLSLITEEGSSITTIKTKLSLLPGRTGRPDEVLSALGISPLEARISREKILLKPLPSIQ